MSKTLEFYGLVENLLKKLRKLIPFAIDYSQNVCSQCRGTKPLHLFSLTGINTSGPSPPVLHDNPLSLLWEVPQSGFPILFQREGSQGSFPASPTLLCSPCHVIPS